MIVLLQQGASLGLRRVRVRDRLRARLRASALDHQLAAGASPESSVALALHATHLCESSHCRLLAHSLTRLAAASDAPARSRLTAPVCRATVRRARAEIDAVVDRLEATVPVDVRGVARIRILLADGTGPLYRDSSADHLSTELRTALAEMEPLA
ncbi:MAG: hypothetical protein ACLQU9_05935 [Acidimicrobiales bacterium]|jgi:hypothetical protein